MQHFDDNQGVIHEVQQYINGEWILVKQEENFKDANEFAKQHAEDFRCDTRVVKVIRKTIRRYLSPSSD